MKRVETDIPDLAIIEPTVFGDERGFFFESWNAKTFARLGLSTTFEQDNHSRSTEGVLRGLHLQNPHAQGKLVRVVAGRIWDVAVDLRRSSVTFGRWFGIELSAANRRMMWIPSGFAHGFLSLEDGSETLYKCTTVYCPSDEHVLLWNDPALAIDWPLGGMAPLLSDKDRAGRPLREIEIFT